MTVACGGVFKSVQVCPSLSKPLFRVVMCYLYLNGLNMEATEPYLLECRKRIENQLQWADSKYWRHQEFVLLSDKILDKTGVSLSPNTLKRLWGKVTYGHQPNTTTLNTLAIFLEYENWVEFIAGLEKETLVEAPGEENKVLPETIPVLKYKSLPVIIESFFIISLLGLMAMISLQFVRPAGITVPAQLLESVEFKSDKIVAGVPNTVVFTYDVTKINGDRFYIQQNWDDRLRFEIDPTKKEVTSTYYYPGYWRAKIMVDTLVLKEHDLIVESDGWLITLDEEKNPRYFLKEEMTDQGLSVRPDIYENAIAGKSTIPWMTAHYVDDFGKLELDNLDLELEIKNGYRSGLTPCANIQVVVLGSENIFSIPLSQPGCVGDLRLRLGNVVKEGRDHNLVAFGRNLDLVQKIKLIVRNRQASIFINGELVQMVSYQDTGGTFYGLRIKFKGLGMAHSVQVRDSRYSGDPVIIFPPEDHRKKAH